MSFLHRHTALLWFRNDLRLGDHPALHAAIASSANIIPVFILEPEEESQWSPGGATRWWLHHSLSALSTSLEARGSRLVLRYGNAQKTLLKLAEETGAQHVYWIRHYEPEAIARDTAMKATLQSSGISAESFNGSLLFEPWEVRTGEGKFFQVFTPFSKACLAAPAPAKPIPPPEKIPSPRKWPASLTLSDLHLEPRPDWAGGLRDMWVPGEAGAHALLKSFKPTRLAAYSDHRDDPGIDGTSRLSPHLHFGEISPQQVWHAFSGMQNSAPYLRQILWREFAHYMLFHHPATPLEPFRPEFRHFPWRLNPKYLETHLHAWTKGLTGYPLVDAGMRQLWHTGWMHNRVRMVVASFLVKHLLIPWQEGALWFWDTLVDADLANNTFGWQWTAGCGADAAPYFRVFNPTLQSRKFSPDGNYIRRWVPELAQLDDNLIHEPSIASPIALAAAGIKLGETYPYPIVEHAAARNTALQAFDSMRRHGK